MYKRQPDLRVRELLSIAPLVIALLALGLHPRLLLGATEPRTLELHRRTDPAGPTQVASLDLGVVDIGACTAGEKI